MINAYPKKREQYKAAFKLKELDKVKLRNKLFNPTAKSSVIPPTEDGSEFIADKDLVTIAGVDLEKLSEEIKEKFLELDNAVSFHALNSALSWFVDNLRVKVLGHLESTQYINEMDP